MTARPVDLPSTPAAELASPSPVPPRQRPWPGRVLLWLVGVVVLSFVLLLPYSARIRASDAIGRAMNATYHAFVRVVRWFLSKLEE